MAQITEPPVIPNLSLPVPQRTDPESFSPLMDRTLLEIPLTVDGINLTVRWTYDTAQLVYGFYQAAAQSAADAAQQVELAKQEVQLAKNEVALAKQEVSKARGFAQDSAVSASASEQARQGVEQLVDAITGEIGLPETGTVGAALIKMEAGVAFAKARLGDHALASSTPIREAASNVTALTYQVIGINTSAATRTVTLPANPAACDWVSFYDVNGTWDKNNPIIARNGQNIMGLAENMTIDIKGSNFTLTFLDASRGWVITA